MEEILKYISYILAFFSVTICIVLSIIFIEYDLYYLSNASLEVAGYLISYSVVLLSISLSITIYRSFFNKK